LCHNSGCTCTSWALLKLRLKSRKSEVEGEGEGEGEDEEGLSEMQSPLPLNKLNCAAISDRREEKRQNWKEQALYPTHIHTHTHTHTPPSMLVGGSSVTFAPLTTQTPDFCNGKLNIHPSIHPSVYPNPHNPHTKADKQTDMIASRHKLATL